MAKSFLIESKHSEAECLNALDRILEENPQLLEKCYMACMAGDHTGWATVEAEDESQARNMLPGNLRGNAKVIEVSLFTPDQIRSFHQMK